MTAHSHLSLQLAATHTEAHKMGETTNNIIDPTINPYNRFLSAGGASGGELQGDSPRLGKN